MCLWIINKNDWFFFLPHFHKKEFEKIKKIWKTRKEREKLKQDINERWVRRLKLIRPVVRHPWLGIVQCQSDLRLWSPYYICRSLLWISCFRCSLPLFLRHPSTIAQRGLHRRIDNQNWPLHRCPLIVIVGIWGTVGSSLLEDGLCRVLMLQLCVRIRVSHADQWRTLDMLWNILQRC